MQPTTTVPTTLTLNDYEVLLTMLLKQTALPGEAWLNTFASLKQQRDAFLKAATTPVPVDPAPEPAPLQEG